MEGARGAHARGRPVLGARARRGAPAAASGASLLECAREFPLKRLLWLAGIGLLVLVAAELTISLVAPQATWSRLLQAHIPTQPSELRPDQLEALGTGAVITGEFQHGVTIDSDCSLERGVPLAVVMIPARERVYTGEYAFENLEGYELRKPQRLLGALFEREGIGFIDLLPLLTEGGLQPELYYPIDLHWTPRGTAQAAELLQGELDARGALTR